MLFKKMQDSDPEFAYESLWISRVALDCFLWSQPRTL